MFINHTNQYFKIIFCGRCKVLLFCLRYKIIFRVRYEILLFMYRRYEIIILPPLQDVVFAAVTIYIYSRRYKIPFLRPIQDNFYLPPLQDTFMPPLHDAFFAAVTRCFSCAAVAKYLFCRHYKTLFLPRL